MKLKDEVASAKWIVSGGTGVLMYKKIRKSQNRRADPRLH